MLQAYVMMCEMMCTLTSAILTGQLGITQSCFSNVSCELPGISTFTVVHILRKNNEMAFYAYIIS